MAILSVIDDTCIIEFSSQSTAILKSYSEENGIDNISVHLLFEGNDTSYRLPCSFKKNHSALLETDHLSLLLLLVEKKNKRAFLFLFSNASVQLSSEELTARSCFYSSIVDFSLSDRLPGYPKHKFEKPKKLAIFTHVYNEDFFLRIFIKYYSRWVRSNDIYILDHGSDQIDVKKICLEYDVNYIPVPKPALSR